MLSLILQIFNRHRKSKNKQIIFNKYEPTIQQQFIKSSLFILYILTNKQLPQYLIYKSIKQSIQNGMLYSNKQKRKYLDYNSVIKQVKYTENKKEKTMELIKQEQFQQNKQIVESKKKCEQVVISNSDDKQLNSQKLIIQEKLKTNKQYKKQNLLIKSEKKQLKILADTQGQPISDVLKQDIFCVNDLSQIQKSLFAPPIYLWVDQNVHQNSNNTALKLLKDKDIDPILCESVEEAKEVLEKSPPENQNIRIISSAKLGQKVCKEFQNNKKVVHIYIFCAYKPAGEALKNKWKKIKFYTIDVPQFIIKIEQQSKYDNKYAKLANFMEITNKDNSYDNTIINKSRYNLYGLFLFKNRMQAKNDFIRLVKYINPTSNNIINKQLKNFQDQYPVEYDHPIAMIQINLFFYIPSISIKNIMQINYNQYYRRLMISAILLQLLQLKYIYCYTMSITKIQPYTFRRIKKSS